MTTTNPPTELPKIHALAPPIVDVPTPTGWVLIVRAADHRRFPQQEGKFCSEYWTARVFNATGDDQGDVVEADDEGDPEEALIKLHRDVVEGLAGGGEQPVFFETVSAAAAAAIAAARAAGADLDEHLCAYVDMLARDADLVRADVPAWGDIVFKRDALEAMRMVGCTKGSVKFIESDEDGRQVHVDIVFRGEVYEVLFQSDGEHDEERQDVVLQAIRDLPLRHAAAKLAEAADQSGNPG